MKLTANQVKNLPDGTELKLFYSGSEWGDEFGKVFNVVKYGNRLYHVKDFDDIDEIDCNDGYEIEAAIKNV